MIELSNVALPLGAGLLEGQSLLRDAAARACGVGKKQIVQVRLLRRGVDARKRRDVHFVATLGVELAHSKDEQRVLRKGAAVRGVQVRAHVPYEPLQVPDLSGVVADGTGAANEAGARAGAGLADDPAFVRPIVIGAGPAGLFAALYLAKAGLRPLVLERGGTVEERTEAVEKFFAGGPLNPDTNVQFGEGGAGTFSDGKLTTGIKSPYARHVLQWFVEAGAPEDILWQGKAHIGTDLLRGVVRNLRERIVQLGGQVRFHAQVVDFTWQDGAVSGVVLQDGETLAAVHVVLATGHSARDTFATLRDAGLHLQRKPFSMGVRIEHRQQAINQAQYGEAANHPALGAADYKMAVHTADGRGVYTFCMCPGGMVVPAASESGRLCVNGMSNHARDGENANAAVLVGLDPADFPGDDVLAGMEWQRQVEEAAYQLAADAGPYTAPAQTVGDFLSAESGHPSATVTPTYARGVAWRDLRACLPPVVTDALAEALPLFDRRLAGFADPEAVMTGVEARSSSPVRLVRDESLQAQFAADLDAEGKSHAVVSTGLYPCGEGAGYAGGIMSAACDGLRVAAALCQNLEATRQVPNRG